MFSPSEFNDAVPQFDNGNYASNPLNPLYVEEPSAIDYNRGVEPLQTLPAQWWNWLGNQFTSKLNKLNIYVKNIFDELTQLLSLLGITPDATEGSITTGQLKGAFKDEYPKYVSDKPPILKTENETLSAGTDGRYNVDSTVIKYASTSNITPLYGIQTVDGATPTDGDFILIKDQTDPTQNGIYEYNSLGDWTRVTGYTTPADLLSKIFNIKEGTANAGKMFYLSDTAFEDDTTFGTDDINFIEYFGSVAPRPSTTVVRDTTGHVKTADPVEADDAINLRSAALALYPVGTLYWTGKAPNDGGDPNVLFGGTWVQIKDKFILAAGDTYPLNGTGGKATVALSTEEMPRHNHGGATGTESADHAHKYSGSVSGGGHSHTYDQVSGTAGGGPLYNAYGGTVASANVGGDGQHSHSYSGTTEGVSANHTHSISSEGGKTDDNVTYYTKAHENMPPYVVKYCWERTA